MQMFFGRPGLCLWPSRFLLKLGDRHFLALAVGRAAAHCQTSPLCPARESDSCRLAVVDNRICSIYNIGVYTVNTDFVTHQISYSLLQLLPPPYESAACVQ